LIGALALALLVFPHATTDPWPKGHPPLRAGDRRPTTDEEIERQAGWEIISTQARERLLRLARWSAVLTMLAGFGLLLAQAAVAGAATGQNVPASAWSLIAGTSYGLYWLLRQALLVGLLITLALGRKRPDGARTTFFSILYAAFCMLVVIAQALQGHATAFAELSALRVAADALHMLAAGIWVGGLLALAVAVVPLLRAGPEQVALAWAILRRFGRLAAGSLAALLITGLFMSGQQVASLDALLTTLYGRALLLKIGLASAVALIGLRNATALHPRCAGLLRWPAAALTPELPRHPSPAATREGTGVRGNARLARTVLLEAIGASIVLLLAAFLSAAQPARGPEFDPPVAASQASATTNAGDLVITLALKPNRPGQNFVTLGVFDTRRPAPAPIGEVAVQFQAPGAQDTSRLVASLLGKGRYELTDDSISGAGDMNIAVTIHRPGLPDATAVLPWTVLPPVRQPRAVLISNQPLAPWAGGAALGLALLLIFTLIGLRLRRHMISLATSFKSTISSVVGRRLRPLRKD
jgi:copper transport protein